MFIFSKQITALKSYDLKAVTYMIRGKMMSCFVFVGYSQPIYKYILTRREKKVKEIFKKFFKS